MVKNSDMSAKSEMGNPPSAECGMRNAELKAQVRSPGLAPTSTLARSIPHSAFRTPRLAHSALPTPHSALSSHPRPRPSPQEPQQDSAGPDLGELLRRRARHPPGGAGEANG